MAPGSTVDLVLDGRRQSLAVAPRLEGSERDPVAHGFRGLGIGRPRRVISLDEHGAIRRDVARAGLEEVGALPVVVNVDELAGEENAPESTPEVEPLDGRMHGLRTMDLGEHLGRAVHRDDRVSELEEPMRHPPGARPELEDLRPRRDRLVDELWLPEGRHPGIELDRRAVVGDRAAVRTHRSSQWKEPTSCMPAARYSWWATARWWPLSRATA